MLVPPMRRTPQRRQTRPTSVSIGGPGNDHFVFTPGVGADSVANFNPHHDTVELNHSAETQNIQELQSLVTPDAHGDASINLSP